MSFVRYSLTTKSYHTSLVEAAESSGLSYNNNKPKKKVNSILLSGRLLSPRYFATLLPSSL